MDVQPFFTQFTPFMQSQKEPGRAKQHPFTPTPLDALILRYVKDYHFVTAWQLVKLHYRDGSLTRARVKLLRLYQQGYLDRRALPDVRVGQPTYVYALATKGINYLKGHGYAGFSRYRPNELQEFTYLHLEHVLRLNDVLIAARKLSGVAPDITLEEMRHDLVLKKTPAKVTYVYSLPTGEKTEESVSIVPDAWLLFHLQLARTHKKREKGIVLELDRGSETNIAKFKKKLRAYVHYGAEGGAHYQMFGTHALTIAYATTAGETRRHTMQRWCEQELQEQGLTYAASLFRFTALPQDTIDPKTVFLGNGWYTPYETSPAALLWKP